MACKIAAGDIKIRHFPAFKGSTSGGHHATCPQRRSAKLAEGNAVTGHRVQFDRGVVVVHAAADVKQISAPAKCECKQRSSSH